MENNVINIYKSRDNKTVAMQKKVSEFPANVQALISQGEIIWVYLDTSGKVIAEDNWGDSHDC